MDIRQQLLEGHSKANAVLIRDWIGGDARRLEQLMQLFLQDEEYRVVQRAAQVITLVGERHKALLQPHLGAMVLRMGEPGLPVAVKRNVVRILQQQDIPESLHGTVMNTCFDLLADVRETVAVRAFSMTVLANLARQYPEIKPELKALIRDGLEQEPTPGYKSRALKTLKRL